MYDIVEVIFSLFYLCETEVIVKVNYLTKTTYSGNQK